MGLSLLEGAGKDTPHCRLACVRAKDREEACVAGGH